MVHRYVATVAAVLAVSSCDAGLSEPEETLGPFAEAYLNTALDVMELHSIRRFEIDWVAFREQTFEEAGTGASPVDMYPAIESALERIGDGHSFFQRAPGSAAALAPGRRGSLPIARSRADAVEGASVDDALTAQLGPALVDPTAALLASSVGYVDVPEFQGGGDAGDALATDYHRLIESVDTLAEICRWVIDLRGNQGGNMWPMVAGIGPILGDGAIGSFAYPDSAELEWFYEDGRAGLGGITWGEATLPYTLASPDPFVAVLTDSVTASSGEAVAVAFRGREGTRSFGEPTYGVSTANEGFRLNDGAVIFLTVAAAADRLGTVYGDKLEPDELVTGGTKTGDPESDIVLDAAMTWLSMQACG